MSDTKIEIFKESSRRLKFFKKLIRRKLTLIGLIICAIYILLVIFAPLIMPYDPNHIDVSLRLNSPNSAHWMGTDELGRDILSRLMAGTKISMIVVISTVIIGMVLGTTLGVISGYYRGKTDLIISNILDAMWSFPTLVLALAITAVLGAGLVNIIIAISIVYSPSYGRLVRSTVLLIRESDYVEGAIAVGLNNFEIITRYVLPNTYSCIIVQASLNAAHAVIAEASLSFLGVGVQPPQASWGVLLKTGFNYLHNAPWYSIFAGIAIFLMALGLNFIGDGFRDALDVKLKDV